MKKLKLIMQFCIGTIFIASKSFGQANPFINVLPTNSGVVNVGATIDIEVTIGNTGPVSAIPQAKLRPIIQVPPSVTFLPTAQQTGLPSGWTILSNTGSQLRVCNSTDAIPVNTSRTITLKVQGVTVAPPQTFSGNINFGNGTTCGAGPTVAGDLITDNSALSTIEVTAPPVTTLNISAFIQGYYAGASTMQPVLFNQDGVSPSTSCDSVTVELHSDLDYVPEYSANTVLSTSGTATATFAGSISGNYYIVLKHRNSLEVWSATAQSFPSTTSYSFSAPGSCYTDGFGDTPSTEVGTGVWALWSGDIDQDGYIDVLDYNVWDVEFAAGWPHTNYSPDLDGNGYVELDDYNLWDPNYQAGDRYAQRP